MYTMCQITSEKSQINLHQWHKATRAFYADMDPPPDDLKPAPTEAAELADVSAPRRKEIIRDGLAREFLDLLNRIEGR